MRDYAQCPVKTGTVHFIDVINFMLTMLASEWAGGSVTTGTRKEKDSHIRALLTCGVLPEQPFLSSVPSAEIGIFRTLTKIYWTSGLYTKGPIRSFFS